MTLDVLGRAPGLARLAERARTGQLSQSLLLVGPEGSGKEAAAFALAEIALSRDVADAEGALRKAAELQHPDLLYVFPAETGLKIDDYRELLRGKSQDPLSRMRQPGNAIISIGDADDPHPATVRAIRRFVELHPFESQHRVVVVGDAHRMNRAAANALLKTLEEPPPTALLILCTHQPHLLPLTIRSRCARVMVPPLTEQALAEHLTERHGLSVPDAARIATVSGANARRAIDMIDPSSRELSDWSAEVFEALVAGRRVALLKAAEAAPKMKAKKGGDASLSAGRDVAVRLIDFLVADLLSVARLAEGAQLAPASKQRLAAHAGRLDSRRATSMASDLMRARSDVMRNVNVALVLTDTFQRICDTEGKDAAWPR